MWMIVASALAWEPHVSGGIGGGAMGLANRLLATPGAGATGSIEVTELIEPVPWLGLGVDTFVGFYPKQCDLCDGYPVLRQGIGPVFRQKRGMLQLGARYAIGTIAIPRQTKVRPFAKSVAILPAGPLDFRIGVYGEGWPAELGLTLELGWWLESGRFTVSRDAKPKAKPPPQPAPVPVPDEVEPAPDTPPAEEQGIR